MVPRGLRGVVKWILVAVAAGGGGLALTGTERDTISEVAAALLGPALSNLMPEKAAVAGHVDANSNSARQRHFSICKGKGRINCVVDGDTFWIDGEKIRISDIDAPETHPPRCAEEARLGEAATFRLQELLNAGPVTLEVKGRAQDQYGRSLRVVKRSGESLGDQLIAEGLARKWDGKRQPWC